MGNELLREKRENSRKSQKIEEFLRKNEKISAFDTHFGDIFLTYLENSANCHENLFIKKLIFHEERSFQDFQQKIAKKLAVSHKNLIKVLEMRENRENLLCSQHFSLYFAVEYLKRDLSSEIRAKRLRNSRFSEAEVANFLRQMINTLSFLQKHGICCENLRSFCIFLDEDQIFKLFDHEILRFPSNFAVCAANSLDFQGNYSSSATSGVYLAPELAISLRNSRISLKNAGKRENFKSCAFTFAVIALEMLNLRTMDASFDYFQGKIDAQSLGNALKAAKSQGISKEIAELLEKCLEFDERKRPDFVELEEMWRNCEEIQREREFRQEKSENFVKNQGFIQKDLNENHAEFARKSRDFVETRLKTLEIPSEIREINRKSSPKIQENSVNIHESLTFPTFSAENQENIEISEFHGENVEKPLEESSESQGKPNNFNEFPKKSFQNLESSGSNQENFDEISINVKEISQDFLFKPLELDNFNENPINLPTSAHFSANCLTPDESSLKIPSSPSIRVEKYEDGSFYQGEFSGKDRQGHGTLYFPDGTLYSGAWFRDKMHGWGTLFFANREKAYEGEWFQGKFQGNGTLFNENRRFLQGNPGNFDNFKDFARISESSWVKYQGNFENHEKHGEGKLDFVDGSSFIGSFVRNRVDGKGKVVGNSGEMFEGEWINNKLVRIY